MIFNYFSEEIKFSFNDKAFVNNVVKEISKTESASFQEINFIFCSDEYLQSINKTYLNKSYYTDIITFPYLENSVISGDIFISIDRVKENAVTFNCTLSYELRRIIVHGLLHLCGYEDGNMELKRIMTSKEDYYLNFFN